MEVLYLSEAEVERLLTMEMALEAVEAAFRHLAERQAQNHPRQRLQTAGGALLHYMAAADDHLGYLGMKLYTSSPAGVRFLVPLYRGDTGALVALLEADYLGRVRTGAASGVATKYMARADASRVGIIGTGHQAPTQLLAIAQVRRLTAVHVYSRTPERRTAFADRMSAALSLPVEAVDTAEKAVRDADIVVTITSAREPVAQGAWLAPGTHINAAGVNSARRRELDATAVARADRIVVDSLEQSQQEAGDLIAAFGDQADRWPRRRRGWQQVRTLAEVVAGLVPGRETREEITLFKSNGVALEDVATAVRVYERAQAEGVGRRLQMWE
ncbi:MAG TPA: ornithine cyclodeaminase family protein [Candidatus Acidoferrales bacterium]|nr:ornithine cyclodeaminase family protein [Candidatus Acidoferrales bacterium]